MKRTLFLLFASSVCAVQWAGAQAVPFKVHGQAWIDGGRIMNASDSALAGPVVDVNDTWLQSSGAQLTVEADLGDHWDGAFGFGAYRATHSLGKVDGSGSPNFLAITMYKSFVTEARLTYSRGEKANPGISFTVGNFVHNYNRDSRNLGRYLLRGPVYPGVLMSGYGDFSGDTTRANVLGARLHHAIGHFSHDLLLMSERDLPPTFDWSLAYIAKYRPLGGALELGAGVNFYRLLPYNSDLTVPGKLDPARFDVSSSMYEVSASGDTTFYSHQGTKLMAMFNLDLKRWISLPRTSDRDLRLYGEAALLGVKDYGEAYGDPMERIPVMLGFSAPTWGLLDLLSLEVEYYGSPHANSLANIGNPAGIVADWTVQDRFIASPGPVASADSSRNNVKWSVNAEKIIKKHIVFSAQVANDHYLPRPLATNLIVAGGGLNSAFTTPEDWYYTFRLGFLF